jgi:hypothetical protein
LLALQAALRYPVVLFRVSSFLRVGAS